MLLLFYFILSQNSEVEIEPPPPGQMPAMSRPMPMSMPRSPMMMMMVPRSPMSMLFQGGIQQLLNNMLRMALTFRRMTGNRSPLPMMEEPCPCDVECCTRPMEPRRLIPILELPMTMHPGCCGCVDCPLSLSPAVSNLVLMARMAGQSRRGGAAGGETR